MPRIKELDPYLHLRPNQAPSPVSVLRSQHTFTIKELAHRTSIPAPTLILAEDGMLTNLPHRLVDYWYSMGLDSERDLEHEMNLWREARRTNHFGIFGPNLAPDPWPEQHLPHPFDYLMANCYVTFPDSPTIGPIPSVGPYRMTVSALSRAIALPNDTVKQYYYRKVAEHSKVPAQLLQAFHDLGYKKAAIRKHVEYFEFYKTQVPNALKTQNFAQKVQFS